MKIKRVLLLFPLTQMFYLQYLFSAPIVLSNLPGFDPFMSYFQVKGGLCAILVLEGREGGKGGFGSYLRFSGF